MASHKPLTVYYSSAGSGKTYTLVKTYLKYALKNQHAANYKHILAITFTNKATQEMLERILSALKKLANKEKSDLSIQLIDALAIDHTTLFARAQKVLEHMLYNFSDISILTIDKFIYRIAKSFSFELGISLQHQIELDSRKICEKATTQLLEEYSKDESLTHVIDRFCESVFTQNESWKIEQKIQALSLLLLEEKSWANLSKEMPWISEYKTVEKKINSTLIEFERRFFTLCSALKKKLYPLNFELFKGGKTQSIKAYANRYYFGKKILLEFSKIYPSKSLIKQYDSGSFFKKDHPENKDCLSFFEEITAFLDEHFEPYVLSRLSLKTIYPFLMLSALQQKISHLYEKLNVIHLSEFSKKISQIVLEEPIPFVYERVGLWYEHVLIDEFQDTSTLQWQNMWPLVEESLSKGFGNMIVGDPKQAIYRFRGGDVQNFIGLENEKKQFVSTKLLDTNYRSAKHVVEFNNAFFTYLKPFLSDHHQSIYKGLEQKVQKSVSGQVYFKKVHKNQSIQELKKQIDRLLEAHYTPSDILILTRKKAALLFIEESLRSMGYKTSSSEQLLLLENKSITLLLSFLRYISEVDNPVYCTNLFAHLNNCIDIPAKDLFSCIKDQEFRHTFIKNVVGLELQNLTGLSLYEICLSLFALPCFEHIPNVYYTAFLDVVLAYQDKKNESIPAFLDYIEDEKESLSISSETDENAIKLMTIHKSKGLESAVVILPSIEWSTQAHKDLIWTTPEHPKKSRSFSAILPKQKVLSDTRFAALYSAEEQEDFLDEVNVLYVAFTRASEVLIGFYDAPKKLAKYLTDFIENKPEFDTVKQAYTLGLLPEKKKQNTTDIPAHPPEKKIKKLSPLDYTYDYSYLKPPLEKHIEKGIVVHDLLSHIYTPKDVERVLDWYFLNHQELKNEKPVYQKIIKSIVGHSDLELFFSNTVTAHNELSFIDHNQELCRADKVVFTEKKVFILDFKTGKESKKDIAQVIHYVNAFKAMGHTNVQGLLFYIRSLSSKQVTA